MGGKEIKVLRAEVDRIDREILDLLGRRAAIAMDIGELKRSLGLPVCDPAREQEIIASLCRLARGPMPPGMVKHIFTEIMGACRALQGPTRICFLGPEATWSHVAAQAYFGRSARFLPRESIVEVFQELERGRADYGVVPVENSMEGGVNQTLDQFVTSGLKICGEMYLRISQTLLSISGEKDRIERVLSHPQALAQCRTWLVKHLPKAELVETASTAFAAAQASEDPKAAAVGGALLAERYGLKEAARDIQDRTINLTRFLVIGPNACEPTGRDKTSIWFAAPHNPGSLEKCLKPFSETGINMTRIESRPAGQGAWEYLFFIDFEGHIQDEAVRRAMKDLGECAERMKVLGSYPRADREQVENGLSLAATREAGATAA